MLFTKVLAIMVYLAVITASILVYRFIYLEDYNLAYYVPKEKEISEPAPYFNLEKFNGSPADLSTMKGEFKYLLFVSPDCQFKCNSQMFYLSDLNNYLKNNDLMNISIYILASLTASTNKPQLNSYISSFCNDFKILFGEGDKIKSISRQYHLLFDSYLFKDYDLALLDHTGFIFLINRKSEIVKIYSEMDPVILDKLIKDLNNRIRLN